MIDIVERLRERDREAPFGNLLNEAADEIERLRTELAFRAPEAKIVTTLRAERDQWKSDCELRSQTAIDRLEALRDCEAEIERLRAENDMLRSLIIDAPTKTERDEIFERRFGRSDEAPKQDADRYMPQTEDEAAELMDNGRNTGGGKMRR
jgi:hypothetical protein